MLSKRRSKDLVPLEYSLDPSLLPLGFLLFLSLVGRGGSHFSISPPYRSFLWNEELLSPFFRFLPWTWHEYTQNPTTDLVLGWIEWSIGVFYICAAFFLVGALLYLNHLIKRVASIHPPTHSQSKGPPYLLNTQNQRLTSPPKILPVIVIVCWLIFGLQCFHFEEASVDVLI